MKRAWLPLMLALLLFCLPALADDAGVLTETELGAWLNGVLLSTAQRTPLNAPIGEEALTEDGYAFLYDEVTLYYNKPVLDAQSVLSALAVTDEALDMPRGIRLGAPAQMLLAAYGWQNPTLAGDGTFAPLYVLNNLPQAAYWAWAQRSGDQLQSVQCAIHAGAGGDRYTDTGVLYTLTNGEVSGIRVYGLNAFVSTQQVQGNLAAVGGVPTQEAGAAAQGVSVVSDAQPFGQSDLQFARMDFLTLTEKGASVLFGQPVDETWAQEDTGGWLHTLQYDGAALVFGLDANRQAGRLESLTFTDPAFEGPRGLCVGATLSQAMALFRSEGSGTTDGVAALLYGDGQTPPFGTLERTGGDATLRYAATLTGADGAPLRVALHLTFSGEQLAEIMLYTF